MNKKIGILGASNSLLANGWHSVITRSFDCTKHAVGGSNSGIGIYKTYEQQLLNNIDIAVINFGVTEHEELKGDFISKQHLSILVNELYKPFKHSKVHCISLLMPIKDVYDKREKDQSLDIHETSCKSSGGIFIDGYKFIDIVLKNSIALNTSDLFLDNHHLKPVIAKYLGEIVKVAIYSLGDHSKELVGCLTNEYVKFEAKTAKLLNSDSSKHEHIKNSNFNETAIKLVPNEKIFINSQGYIHGLFVDCARSETKIKIHTCSESIVKNLYCRAPIIADNKPQLKFCTLHDPLKIDKITSLEVVANNIPKTESNRGERPLKDNNNTAYICGILTSQTLTIEREIYDFPYHNAIQEKIDIILEKYATDCAEAISLLLLDTSRIVNTLLDADVIIDDVLENLLTMLNGNGHSEAANNLNALIMKHNFFNKSLSDKEIISSSTLFDTDFYLNKYPDIARAGVDPIKHYCEFGFKEGRNPSSTFDTKSYIQTKKLKQSQNPLVHYIKSINNSVE